MSIVPLAMLLFIMRKGATTHPVLSWVMTAMSAAAVAYIGLRFTCRMDTIGHATVSHLIPYLTLGFVLAFFARKLYKW